MIWKWVIIGRWEHEFGTRNMSCILELTKNITNVLSCLLGLIPCTRGIRYTDRVDPTQFSGCLNVFWYCDENSIFHPQKLNKNYRHFSDSKLSNQLSRSSYLCVYFHIQARDGPGVSASTGSLTKIVLESTGILVLPSLKYLFSEWSLNCN